MPFIFYISGLLRIFKLIRHNKFPADRIEVIRPPLHHEFALHNMLGLVNIGGTDGVALLMAHLPFDRIP